MPAYFVLEDMGGNTLHTEQVGPHFHLVVEDHSRVNTQFKHAVLADAGTATVVTPPKGSAIVITDLVYTAEKVANGKLTIQFTDGSNTVILKAAVLADQAVDGAIAYAGRTKGWKDARVDMVAAGSNVDADVTVHYYILKGAGVLSFTDWDGERET